MNLQEIQQYSESWYTVGNRTLIPSVDSPDFQRIASEAISFIFDTVRSVPTHPFFLRTKDTPVTLRVSSDTDSGYAEMKKNRVTISSSYFNRETAEQLNFDEFPEAGLLALINGTVIHEGLHLALTPEVDTIPEFVTVIGKHRFEDAIRVYGKQAVYALINIFEDIYIEGNVPEHLSSWLQACSSIFFTEDRLNELTDLTDLEQAINAAILFKNKELRDHPIFETLPKKALHVLMDAAETIGEIRGTQRSYWVNEFLFAFKAPETEEQKSESEGDGEGESQPKFSSDEQLSEETKEALKSLSEEEAQAIDEELKEMSERLSEIEKKALGIDDGILCRRVHTFDIFDSAAKTDYRNINWQDAQDYGFVKELQAIRTENRTPGQARTHGTMIVKQRLSRIATDGKIFAKNDSSRRTQKRLEIIINVDMSGSTVRGDLISSQMSAAKAMSEALMRARISHKVVGHTSYGHDDNPILMEIYSYDMNKTDSNREGRFEEVCFQDTGNNYDGLVVEELVANHFSNRSATRVLINLSDGMPEGYMYRGESGKKHTIQAVNEARQKGIIVFAISTVARVVHRNNEIYGEGFNIDGSKNLASEMRKLVRSIATS